MMGDGNIISFHFVVWEDVTVTYFFIFAKTDITYGLTDIVVVLIYIPLSVNSLFIHC
ncbi:hypothetical protein BDA99DRAFT_521214 [Phascolomyces articulosus]|uniref:Uncharacterized protein n=1 Tax=Phascolomyces articulosus TaxID=60185 RepID=A0AAD5PA14_9FUNG|nr:hypothetical protein BDA99DRAFT_521214 [Phascolomyces articulosus]